MHNEESWKSHELFTYEVDDFEQICGTVCGGQTQLQLTNGEGELGVSFSDMFADTRSCELFNRILKHVRDTSETIGFPFRCDSETHSVYQRCVVFLSSSKRVAFVNRLIGMDQRPAGVRWVRSAFDNSSGESADYQCCSLCNRLKVKPDDWVEFQQLVDEQHWSGDGQSMRCDMDVCPDCERAIDQRIAETRRPHNEQVTR